MNIFITGANRGIGLGLVQQYVKNPDVKRIFAAVRKPGEAKDLHALNDKRVIIIEFDVLDDTKIEHAAQWLTNEIGDEGLHLLFNNAGISLKEDCRIENPSRKTIMDTFNTNVAGVVRTTSALLPLLQTAASPEKPSKIINVSSGWGSIELTTDAEHGGKFGYGASKAALNHYSKQLGTSELCKNIVVVALRPGFISTAINDYEGPLSVEEATTDIVKMVEGLKVEDSGKFLDRFGKEEAW
ncbi:unnamed protein product [Bursaphelenchus xylophilus]|uniref:(pine wood nematode) hypothetical protein n=1 Tax=Bursaphelenchus xylophilus TaxID=6326 RepID=A0A1I7RJF9_BURXY|nr:unnamed protein product [Bursaphelenchus xylophilus]CAG9128857.1 unnamed protein product [Bursaphelenchus xylophilus]